MDRTAYRMHYDLDRRHFWRIAKRRLVMKWLEARLPSKPLRLLDVGGACSVLTSELGRFGDVTLVEPDAEMVRMAKEELGLNALRGSLPDNIPVDGPFDAITLLDVLEHLDDDARALVAVRELLAPGGTLMVTVPACQWLWSSHDMSLHHRRRYSRRELRKVLEGAGFTVERMTYWTSLLLPLVALQRLAGRILSRGRPAIYRVRVPGRALNAALGAVMSIERLALSLTNMPVGSSIIAVCRRPEESPAATSP